MEVLLVLMSAVSLVMGLQCRSSLDHRVKWTVDCSAMNLSAAPPPTIFHPVAILNMSHNVFEHLVESQFINWTDISILDLSRNSIQVIDNGSFKGLNNLTELNLMSNYIQVLSKNITSYLPKLRILNLSSNKLKVIVPGSFEPIPLLLKLFLGNNPNLGNSVNSHSILQVSLTQGLITLDLENTSLTELPKNFFKDANRLISLNIALNPMKDIPELPPSLRSLNISGTLIETVPHGLFSKSELLQRLSLERMTVLKDIRVNALSGLTSLEELYIKDCPRLSFISADAFGESSPKLKKIVISHCALSTLPKTFSSFFSKVEHLNLQGNPWICDGRVSWITNINIHPNLTTDLRCDNPPSAQGMLMADYFRPRSHPHTSLIRAGIVLAMVAILVASVVGMVRHLNKPKVKTYQQLDNIRLHDNCSQTLPPL